MTLRQKWEKYLVLLCAGGESVTIDQGNKLIVEIEKEMPFKDNKEHEKWLHLGEVWKGEDNWLTLTDKIIKRTETIVYHIGLKRGVSYLFNGYVEYTLKDYWTSIKTGEGASDNYVKRLAVANLMKQVAKDMVGNVRAWKRVEIDSADLMIERKE